MTSHQDIDVLIFLIWKPFSIWTPGEERSGNHVRVRVVAVAQSAKELANVGS